MNIARKPFAPAWTALVLAGLSAAPGAQPTLTRTNPFLYADIPDPSIVRVGDKYYMSHTTMHMTPGVPVMESSDMVHWKTVSYVYNTFANTDAMNLANGKSAYGKGSWASSIRYKDGTFYVLFPSYSTSKTYLYTTKDVTVTPWKLVGTYNALYHDPSLLMDDDGRNYIVYGGGDIKIVELTSDLTGVKSGGMNKTLVSSAQSIAKGSSYYVTAEGSHIEKIKGYYYLFNICWPAGASRTETVYRSSSLSGSFTGQVGLQSSGVAQGGIFQAADSSWWGLLFADNGPVGRSPWLVPVTWSDNWPIFNNGKAPGTITVPASPDTLDCGIVTSDDFSGTSPMPEWQWNHNPDNANWSVSARPGYYRITTSRVDSDIRMVRNSLTQRSFGPTCSGRIALDASGLKDGDIAGIAALQDSLGYVAVKKSGGSLSVVQCIGKNQKAIATLGQDRVYLRIDMDFTKSKASFFYGLDSTSWKSIGSDLSMNYTLGMFMGYRFTLFDWSTTSAGGHADFDWFKIGASATSEIVLHHGPTSVLPANARSIAATPSIAFSRVSANAGKVLSASYALPRDGRVEILLLSPSGKVLRNLEDATRSAGSHEIGVDVSDLPAGRYFLLGRLDGGRAESSPVAVVR